MIRCDRLSGGYLKTNVGDAGCRLLLLDSSHALSGQYIIHFGTDIGFDSNRNNLAWCNWS